MTISRGLFVRAVGTTGTTPIEARLALAGMVAENAPGSPRNGLLFESSANVVTGATDMSYNVAGCNPVVNRAANEGVYLMSFTGTTNIVTGAAPSTGNARWDLVYVKQNDPDKGDPDNQAVLGVVQGTAAPTPVKPTASVPAGGYVLAESYVPSGVSSTSAAGVVITQTWVHTAMRGAPIPVRNQTERDAITAFTGLLVSRLDQDGGIRAYNGTSWGSPGGIRYIEYRGNAYPQNGSQWGPAMPPIVFQKNAGFCSWAQNDQLTFSEEGVYAISVKADFGGAASGDPETWIAVRDPANARALAVNAMPAGSYDGFVAIPNLYIAAGDTVWIKFTQYSGATQTWDVQTRIVKTQ